MAIIKGLDGGSGAISVNGKSRSFSNIGQTFAGTASLARGVVGLTMPVIDDAAEFGDTADRIEIVSQPAVGRAIARSDGRISVDLLKHDPIDDLTIVYDRAKDGAVTRVTATVSVAPAPHRGGWAPGDIYQPEIDPATNKVVWEAGPNSRMILGSPEGLTWAQIAAREPGFTTSTDANTRAQWIRDNRASGSGGAFYGETPELAVATEVAVRLMSNISRYENDISPVLLFKYGSTVTFDSSPLWCARGYSPLEPIVIGAWGDPADGYPVLQPNVDNSTLGHIKYRVANVLIQDMASSGGMWFQNGPRHVCVDGRIGYNNGVGHGHYVDVGGADDGLPARHVTTRRLHLVDAYQNAIVGNNNGVVGKWEGNMNRVATMYRTYMFGCHMEDVFMDLAGYQPGYRADWSWDYPQPPAVYNHCIYDNSNSRDLTFRNVFLSRGSQTGFQTRSGGVYEDVVTFDCNVGMLIGQGPQHPSWGEPGRQNFGSYTSLDGYVNHVAGLLMFPGFKAVGLDIAGRYELSLSRASCGNLTPLPRRGYNAYVDGNTIGPCTDFVSSSTLGVLNVQTPDTTFAMDDYKTFGWSLTPNRQTAGIDSAILDGTTATTYMAEAHGVAGASYLDMIDAYREMDEPWADSQRFVDWWNTRLGNAVSTRTAPATVVFRPTGHTAGNMAMFKADWSTRDLPGRVAGDSVDLDGHAICWNITPATPVKDLRFGAGGGLRCTSGLLAPTGRVITAPGGNAVEMYLVGRFYIPGFDQPHPLSVDVTTSRFMNKGVVSGRLSVTARYRSQVVLAHGAASFALGAGDVLDIRGDSRVGFDGQNGEAGDIRLQAGSLTRFAPTTRMYIDGVPADATHSLVVPKRGSTLTGAVSGATGVVRYVEGRPVGQLMVVMDTLTGSFVDNEALHCDDCEAGMNDLYGPGDVGLVNGTPAPVLGAITEMQTGIHGYKVPPDVDSTISLEGGALEIDVTGVADVTDHVLMQADSIAHLADFGAVSVIGGAGRDVRVAVEANRVLLSIAAGTGQTLVSYPG